MQEEWRLDAGHRAWRWRLAIEHHPGIQGRSAGRQFVAHTATPAKAHAPHFAGAVGVLFEIRQGRPQVFQGGVAVELANQITGFVLIGRGAPRCRQHIRCQGQEAFQGARRVTSSICGCKPRFSWMTMMAGSFLSSSPSAGPDSAHVADHYRIGDMCDTESGIVRRHHCRASIIRLQ